MVPFAIVLPGVIFAAMAVGAINGAVSSLFAVHPRIATLGTGTALQGGGAALDTRLSDPAAAAPAWRPFTLLLAAGVILLLTGTVYGRRLYALGSNQRAAQLALVNQVGIWTITFALSARFAALAGILLLGFSGSAYAAVGAPYLFQTFAAVVIGGTVLIGGRGGYLGTFAGALCLIELTTVLVGLGLQSPLVQSTLGVAIVVLVSIYGREPHVRELV